MNQKSQLVTQKVLLKILHTQCQSYFYVYLCFIIFMQINQKIFKNVLIDFKIFFYSRIEQMR